MTSPDFHGVKIALFSGADILVYRRDRKPGLRHAGCWDLPGGGREGAETPDECVLREVEEEFGIRLDPAAIAHRRSLPSRDFPGHVGWFMVGTITAPEIASIRFGSEGEEWRMMPAVAFVADDESVFYLRDRLADYLAELDLDGNAA